MTPPPPKAAASVTREPDEGEEEEEGGEDGGDGPDTGGGGGGPRPSSASSSSCSLEWSLALQYPTPEPPRGGASETPDPVQAEQGQQQQQPRAKNDTTNNTTNNNTPSPPPPPPPPLPSLCARLCERHCAKLWDFNGEDGGEPCALDAACGAGGCTFALADVGFASVLGVDGSQAHVLAAKELRESGEVEYRGEGGGGGGVGGSATTTAAAVVARVPDGVDRDRVRFWHCPAWPGALPPKLQPVDCVLVADADAGAAAASGGAGQQQRRRRRRPSPRVPRGGVASLVAQAAPGMLTPGGVLVVVLAGAPSSREGEEEEEEEEEGGRGGAAATEATATTTTTKAGAFAPLSRLHAADPRWRTEVGPALSAALEDGELEVVCEHARLEFALGAAATATAGGARAVGVASAAVFRRRGGRGCAI